MVGANHIHGCEPDLQQSRSCLGCCATLPLSTAMDEPSKGLGIQGKSVNKPSYSEDFWSTSTCEMDNIAAQSQRSVSSMSTSNPLLDPHNSACSTSNRTEFVNHGKSKLLNVSCCILLAEWQLTFLVYLFKFHLSSCVLTHHLVFSLIFLPASKT